MKLRLDLKNQTRYQVPSKRVIKGWILDVLKDQNLNVDVEIGLKIVNKAVIHNFNKKYRKVDSPTDVLSFPLFDKIPADAKEKILLGDIVICYEIMTANAKKYGSSLEGEFKKLIIHSTLHLLGCHHK